jgi:hypothetical protein
VPFTRRNIKEDLEDIGSVFDGPPDLEFRAATKDLALERAALSYQRVPPGYRFPYGHTHEKQEAWRGYEAGPDGLEMLVIGAPNLGEDPRGDVDGRRDWWTD